MRMLTLVPWLLALIGCGSKETPPGGVHNTSNTAGTNSVSMVLTTWKDHESIANPTEAELRNVIAALDDKEIGPRLVLSLDGGNLKIELSGTPRDGFGLDYRDLEAREGGYVYASKRTDLSAETVTKVLVAVRDRAPDWRSLIEWQKLKM